MSLLAILIAVSFPAPPSQSGQPAAQPAPWELRLRQELPLLGHRNWVVVADSAYPWQTSPGVETVETGADHIDVVRTVLADLSHAPHVRPVLFVDAELPYVTEADAPGIDRFRETLLKTVLGRRPVQYLLHEKIIANLDEAGKTFHVLLLKTRLTIPYTSVFFQLNCGYWSDAAEARLRAAMSGRR